MRPPIDHPGLLVRSVDIAAGAEAVQLGLKEQEAGPALAGLVLAPNALRQWLGIVYAQYLRGDWPTMVWPAWLAYIAAKLSERSQGGITYVLLADIGDDAERHLAVIANEGGGLWCKETVRLDTLEAVLDAHAGQPFPTKALRGAMVGRSNNNPPFCVAVLKDLGLAVPAPDTTTVTA